MLDKVLRVTCRACRYKLCLEKGMCPQSCQAEPSSSVEFAEEQEDMVEHFPSPPEQARPMELGMYEPRTDSRIEEECASVLSKLLLLEDSLDQLRSSAGQCPSVLLDILTKPCALTCAGFQERLKGVRDVDTETFGLLEYAKAFTWFRNLSFLDKANHLARRIPPLLALRLAWHLARGPAGGVGLRLPLTPLIDSISQLQVDRPSLCLLSAVLLTQTNDLHLSAEAKAELEQENTSYTYCLSVYLFKKYGSPSIDQIAQHYLLLGTCVQYGYTLRQCIKGSQLQSSICQQTFEFSPE